MQASGGLEADAGNMLDTKEPLPPQANPEKYPVMRDVAINLHNYQIDIDGTTGLMLKRALQHLLYTYSINIKKCKPFNSNRWTHIATYREHC